MSETQDRVDPIEEAFELAKLQASVDGAFPDKLLRFWFKSAWDRCAEIDGFIWPAREITERITIRQDGSFRLSYAPSSDIRIYDGATLLRVIPRTWMWERSPCDWGLCECCTCCGLKAHYWTGYELCDVPAGFAQAVCRAFTFLCENRGDSGNDERWLTRSGAMSFLHPTFVL